MMNMNIDLDELEEDMEQMDIDGFLEDSLLSEEFDDQWVEYTNTLNEEVTFEQKYMKIRSELKTESNKKMRLSPRPQPVIKKFYKIKINDLLHSEKYKQLKITVMENRINKMTDIEKMLQGEHVDEDQMEEDSRKFLKQRKDHQLLTNLARADLWLQETTKKNTSTNIEASEQNNDDDANAKVDEKLLGEW